ncbi:beta-lactamase family protein [Stipitochalara longipes BDJ]|nr:beta-lactamase family protein [Stipitochalara longipes BDJ]
MERNGKYIKDGQFTPAFDSLVTDSMESWHVPGFSIAVIQDEEVCAKGYGFAAKDPEVPVTTDTLFNCASMSKAFTAAAISLLVDNNEKYPEVQWNAPVSNLIRDDFVLSDSRYTEEVTVEDILSHRSGLPDYDDACMGVYAKEPDTPKSVTRKLRHLPMNEPLRTKWQYSNVMYAAACHLVEALTGQFIGDFLRPNIWAPLKMTNTFYGLSELKQHRGTDSLSKGYRWDEESSRYVEILWPDQPEGRGAGEMISTAHDYAQFLKCMIHQKEPISASGHKDLVKPRMLALDEEEETRPYMSPSCYALGWIVENYHGETIINHGGATNGFRCNMMYLPRLKFGVVVFGNSETSYAVNEKIPWALVDELLSISPEKRYDWDATFREELAKEHLETVEELYSNLPETRLPLALPLEAYAGAYTHAGYGTLAVEYKNGRLGVDATDRTWRFKMSLEHVSGEFFVAEKFDVDTHSKDRIKAQFRLGADGTPRSLGVDLVEGKGDEMVWFQR